MFLKKFLLMTLMVIAMVTFSQAQTYITKNGKISFFSSTAMENIDAVNNQVVSVLNMSNGEVGFSVIIKGFLFKKALMQEHFNDDYMESGTYQKATFKGQIADIKKVDLKKDGDYPVKVNGDLVMHGVSNKVAVNAIISVKSGKVSATAEFNVLLADYKISIPRLVEKSISPTIKIAVDCIYELKN